MDTVICRWLAIFSVLFCAAALGTGVTYKKVTKDGVIYSDRPLPGAEIVELPKAQTYDAPQITNTPSTASPASAPAPYTLFELWKPKNDEVFVNTGNTVSVRARLEPALQPGHSIYIYLDGKRVDGLSTTGDSFELSNVFRGTHSLNAVVADAQGKPLIRSQGVTFHLRQTSVLTRPQPNRPQPPRR